MTASQHVSDRDRNLARTPAPVRTPQKRAADQRDAAPIDPAEFWRRLGL